MDELDDELVLPEVVAVLEQELVRAGRRRRRARRRDGPRDRLVDRRRVCRRHFWRGRRRRAHGRALVIGAAAAASVEKEGGGEASGAPQHRPPAAARLHHRGLPRHASLRGAVGGGEHSAANMAPLKQEARCEARTCGCCSAAAAVVWCAAAQCWRACSAARDAASEKRSPADSGAFVQSTADAGCSANVTAVGYTLLCSGGGRRVGAAGSEGSRRRGPMPRVGAVGSGRRGAAPPHGRPAP